MAVGDQVEGGIAEWDRSGGGLDHLDTEWLQASPGDWNVRWVRLDGRHQLVVAEGSYPFGHPLAPAGLHVQNPSGSPPRRRR